MIRTATPADVPVLVELIQELALYEKAPEECHVTTADLQRELFGDDPSANAFVAVDDREDGTEAVVGTAIWFRSFSTWEGTAGIYLEDLYVRPAVRGRGHGLALLAALADECVRRGWSRLGWAVLNWNTPSIQFYDALGGAPMNDWTTYRVEGDALADLAARV
ncbi:GNAT family N-acetyltransferase [Nakamurella sp. A5-74]|uniref:GNAT family N-acetyltransferase n=1 Tax=Nakamurella sp. A5-74 TaxID=3158264 RepID=A0AAU8DLJ7_9ACTN